MWRRLGRVPWVRCRFDRAGALTPIVIGPSSSRRFLRLRSSGAEEDEGTGKRGLEASAVVSQNLTVLPEEEGRPGSLEES